jgi:PAS domain S-box-containing protein
MSPIKSSADTDAVDTETRHGDSAQGREAADLAPSSLSTILLEHTTDGVIVADGDGVIVYTNKPLLQLFGYEDADLRGEPLEILVPDHYRHDHQRHVQEFVKSPDPRPMGRSDLDIEGRHADGSSFPIDVQLDALPGTGLVVAIVRDMTSQRQATVDLAIARIDLANANDRIEGLQTSLDLVIQRLFALGTSIAAGESNEPVLLERMTSATRGIDEIIQAVQHRRLTSGA